MSEHHHQEHREETSEKDVDASVITRESHHQHHHNSEFHLGEEAAEEKERQHHHHHHHHHEEDDVDRYSVRVDQVERTSDVTPSRVSRKTYHHHDKSDESPGQDAPQATEGAHTSEVGKGHHPRHNPHTTPKENQGEHTTHHHHHHAHEGSEKSSERWSENPMIHNKALSLALEFEVGDPVELVKLSKLPAFDGKVARLLELPDKDGKYKNFKIPGEGENPGMEMTFSSFSSSSSPPWGAGGEKM